MRTINARTRDQQMRRAATLAVRTRGLTLVSTMLITGTSSLRAGEILRELDAYGITGRDHHGHIVPKVSKTGLRRLLTEIGDGS